jgi:hypothetical protein
MDSDWHMTRIQIDEMQKKIQQLDDNWGTLEWKLEEPELDTVDLQLEQMEEYIDRFLSDE